VKRTFSAARTNDAFANSKIPSAGTPKDDEETSMPGIVLSESAGSSNLSAAAQSTDNSEQHLAQRVSDALGKTGHPSLRELKVSIQKGVVILQGEVPNAYLKMLAMTTSLTVGGAWWVVNCLQVSIRPSR
jgi:osmotically-inducible protein OsmY